MRNTSSKYKDQIKGIREFCAKIIINYSDGSSETLTDLQDFKQLKFVDECSGSSEFEIGAAVIGEALITLNNRTGKFDGKNFYGAHISAYTGIMVDSKPELLEMGHYIVDEPVSPGISIALTAYDNMILLDKLYTPKIAYPATLAQIAEDACSQCGVILESLTFPRSAYIVEKAPEEGTCREIMAAVAQLAGCFVKARPNGRIAIAWYADATSKTVDTLYSKTICTDDVTITGITVVSGETTAQSGADGYRLSISDNILLAEDRAQETADYLGDRLIGLSFRPLSVSCQSDPSIEAGDRITVKDEKGNEYQTVVTSTTFAVLEAQKIACNAASPTVNAGQRLSETSKAIIVSRKYADEAVEHERTERETALEELNRQLAESSGMYVTAQKQDDGSTIYYTHDKPELSESQVVCKFTATAMGISTDGGKTYPYGLDVSGMAILKRIYTVGLNADYINTGKIAVKDNNGTILFCADMDTGAVTINFGLLKVGNGYINTDGSFKLGPMESAGDDNMDVIFRRAIMINYGAEIYGNNDDANQIAYIDFHSGADVSTGDKLYDYTGRIQNLLDSTMVSQFAFTGFKKKTGESGTCNVSVNGTLVHTSDRRLKNDISYLDKQESENFLMQLKPARYTYIQDPAKKKHKGLIYDEVKAAIGSEENSTLLATFWQGSTEYGALSYTELIPDLIAALQKQHEEIESLKKKMENCADTMEEKDD